MEAPVKIVRIDKFTSKKGNPCAFVFVSENNDIPYRVLVYDQDMLSRIPAIGATVKATIEPDSNLFGTLRLKW